MIWSRAICRHEIVPGLRICGLLATPETADSNDPRCEHHSFTKEGDRPGVDPQREVPAGLEAGEDPRDVAPGGAGADLKANSLASLNVYADLLMLKAFGAFGSQPASSRPKKKREKKKAPGTNAFARGRGRL